jgi:hypothetical protein
MRERPDLDEAFSDRRETWTRQISDSRVQFFEILFVSGQHNPLLLHAVERVFFL